MAYTRGWSDGTPAGSRAANQIDDAIREFKVDLHERMNTLCVDWAVDPVVLKDENKGAATKKLIIHGTAFQMESNDNGNYGDTGISGLGTFQPFRTALPLPPGVTITKVRWLVTNNNAVLLTCDIRSTQFSVGVPVAIIDHRTTVAVGVQILDSGVIAVLIADTEAYHLVADTGGGLATTFLIHAVEITYTCPDSRFTR